MIQNNMGLVVKIAKGFNPSNAMVLDEYIQAGRIGLLKAIRTHNIKRSTFGTTAWHHIRWGILEYIKHEQMEPVLPITMEPSGETYESITDYLPNTLSEREREVILLRNQGHTFKDIGEIHGYSKSWANYIFHSGILKVKRANDIEYD